MERQQSDRRTVGMWLVVAGAIAIAVALTVFFLGPYWRGNALLFRAGVIACLVGFGLQGRRGPGLVLLGLGALLGFGAWFLYEVIMASESYPPSPLWPAYALGAVALGVLIAGVVLLLRPPRGKRRRAAP